MNMMFPDMLPDAGVTIDGYEITISGDVPDGISRTTAEMGVSDESYSPSYSENELDVNKENLFTAATVIYDETGRTRSVQISKQCYINDGQVIGLDIDVPKEAGDGWYIVVIMIDNSLNMKPVLREKLTIFK